MDYHLDLLEKQTYKIYDFSASQVATDIHLFEYNREIYIIGFTTCAMFYGPTCSFVSKNEGHETFIR